MYFDVRPVKTDDKMQMDPGYCFRRLTGAVNTHLYVLVVVLLGTDG